MNQNKNKVLLEKPKRLLSIEKKENRDLSASPSLNISHIASPCDIAEKKEIKGIFKKDSYYPPSLKEVFESKIKELAPALKNKEDEQKLLYSLERL